MQHFKQNFSKIEDFSENVLNKKVFVFVLGDYRCFQVVSLEEIFFHHDAFNGLGWFLVGSSRHWMDDEVVVVVVVVDGQMMWLVVGFKRRYKTTKRWKKEKEKNLN